jgi:hypothetical protein
MMEMAQARQRIHRLHRARQRGHPPRGLMPSRATSWAAPPRLPQMPAYHLVRQGPQRHHHGQHRRGPGQCQDHHRPHRRAAPARLDDAGPLRRPAQQPAAGRLRAGPRLCARRPCAGRRAAAVGAHPGAGGNPAGAGAGGGRRDPGARLRPQAHHAHRHRGQHRQPQLGTAARQPAPAPLQPEPRRGAGHGKRHHRRQRLPLSGALRHAAVRERQAAARRDQAARHGQPFLPRARGPAPAHRHAGHRDPACQGVDLHSRKLRSFAEVAFQ